MAFYLRRALACACVLLALTACASQPHTNPDTLPDAAAPAETALPSPAPSPTPIVTPVPPATLAVGRLPSGQALFGIQRSGSDYQELWRMETSGLSLVRTDIVAAGWNCAGAQPARCAWVAADKGLYALDLPDGEVRLLDILDGWPVITPTVSMSSTAPTSPALPAAAVISPTIPFTPSLPISPVLPSPTLALDPTGAALAVLDFAQLRIYDVVAPALLATLPMVNPVEIAWSPDGAWLALASTNQGQDTVWLWEHATGQLAVLAQTQRAHHLAWSPDSSKLAFDAAGAADTPSNQGAQSDIFVWSRAGGEISNVTDLFLTNGWIDPAYQIAAWSPQWEPDGDTLRYLRGLPAQPDSYTWTLQPLSGERYITLLSDPVLDAVLTYPAHPVTGTRLRTLPRDDRDALQQSPDGSLWLDASPGTFAALRSAVWQPDTDAAAAAPRLLLADRQSLLLLDLATGKLNGLAVVCAACEITDAVWLP